jgi:hypothetical protein
MKNQFISHGRHIMSPLKASLLMLLRFEVFTAVTMKNTVPWDVMSCGSC